MSIKANIFSSKPQQIAQAAIQVVKKVFGTLKKINLIVISDMKLPLNIAENFKTSGLEKYNVLDEPIDKLVCKIEESVNSSDDLIHFLMDYDMIIIGYKSQSKLIDKSFAQKLLKKRKQRPIFLVDCGVPGNINMSVGKINNCFLFDLNDLEQLYSSWIQNNTINYDASDEFYDVELRSLTHSFFEKLDLSLEQKTIFEKRIEQLIRSKENDIRISLKKFLKVF